MEKLVVARSRNNDENRNVFCATRYGNVMASRGSVIPLFISQVQSGQPITITDPDMTRFIMSLDEAVDLVLFAFDHAENGDLFVRKAPGVKMRVLAEAILRLMGKEDHPIKIIGTRHGEKKAETLLSREEMITSQDLGDYFRVPPDNRDLNYERFFSSGELGLNEAQDYNSENSGLLNVEQTMEIVGTLGFVRSAIETGKMESSS
ncbi:MAG: polysaccharide biosynthesis protein [Filomicrobium sp.]